MTLLKTTLLLCLPLLGMAQTSPPTVIQPTDLLTNAPLILNSNFLQMYVQPGQQVSVLPTNCTKQYQTVLLLGATITTPPVPYINTSNTSVCSWLAYAGGAGGGTNYQTFESNGAPLTQRPVVNLSNGTNTTVVCSDNAGAGRTDCTTNATAGNNYQTVDSNGTPLTQRPSVNFISGSNASVTCIDNSGSTRTDCTVASSGGNNYQTVDSNGTAVAQRPTVNLISGANATVTCVDNAGATRTDCTVASSGGNNYQTVDSNGTPVAQRPTVNLISGTNSTVTCVDNAGATRTDCTVASSGGNNYQTVDSNGTPVAQRPTVNLISGANATVTCVDNAGATRTDCTVSSSGGGAVPALFFYTDAYGGNVASAFAAASAAGGGTVIVNQNYSSGAPGLVLPSNTVVRCLPGISITQTNAANGVIFLTSPGSVNSGIEGCTLIGGNYGIAGFTLTGPNHFTDNVITGFHVGAVNLTGGFPNTTFSRNIIKSAGSGCSEGVFFQDPGDNLTANDNTLDTTGCGAAHGIALHTFAVGGTATNWAIKGNTILNGGTNFAIEVQQNNGRGMPSFGVVDGNKITLAVGGFGGISFGGVSQASVTNNPINMAGTGPSIAGIEIADSQYVTVIGNTETNTAGNGGALSLDSNTNVTVTGNVFSGNSYMINSGTFAGVTQLSFNTVASNIFNLASGNTTTHGFFMQCNVASCLGTNNKFNYNTFNGTGVASSYAVFVEQDLGTISGTQAIGNLLNTYSAGSTGFQNGALGQSGGLIIDTGGAPITTQISGTPVATSATLNLVPGPGILLAGSSPGGISQVQASVDTAVVAANSAIQNSTPLFVTNTSASATVYTGTMNPTLTTYGTGGATVIWQVGTTACTGGTATTLNIDALGAKAIKLADGTTNPTSSDCSAGKLPTLRYDGTVFRIVGGGAAGSGGTTLVSPWGTWASRPSCTVAGQQWFATDGVGLTSICDGSTWHDTYLGIPITLPGLVSTYTNVNGGTATDTAGTIVFNKSTTGLGVELKLIPTGTGAGQQSGVWTVIGAFQAQETANFQSCGIYFTNGTATSSNAFGLVVPYRNDIAQPSFIQENEYGPISGGLSSSAFGDNILLFPSPLVWFRFQRLNSATNTISFDIGDGRTWSNVGSVTETFQPTNYGFGCDPRGTVNANLTIWSLPTIQ